MSAIDTGIKPFAFVYAACFVIVLLHQYTLILEPKYTFASLTNWAKLIIKVQYQLIDVFQLFRIQ